jgi:hypothetical protein
LKIFSKFFILFFPTWTKKEADFSKQGLADNLIFNIFSISQKQLDKIKSE